MLDKFRECLRAVECLPLDVSGEKLTVLSVFKLFQSTMNGKAIEGVSEEMLTLAYGMSNSDFPLRLFRAWLIVRASDGGNFDALDESQNVFTASAAKPVRVPKTIANDFDDEDLVREVPEPDDEPVRGAVLKGKKRPGDEKDQKVSRPAMRVRTKIPSLPEIDLVEYVGAGMFKAVKVGTRFESLISKHHIADGDLPKVVHLMETAGENQVVWQSDEGARGTVEKRDARPLRLS